MKVGNLYKNVDTGDYVKVLAYEPVRTVTYDCFVKQENGAYVVTKHTGFYSTIVGILNGYEHGWKLIETKE